MGSDKQNHASHLTIFCSQATAAEKISKEQARFIATQLSQELDPNILKCLDQIFQLSQNKAELRNQVTELITQENPNEHISDAINQLVDGDTLTIGRANENNIVLQNEVKCSRDQCQISRADDLLYIEPNKESPNKLFLQRNGESRKEITTKIKLESDDIVQLGKYAVSPILEFTIPEFKAS